MTFMSDPLLDGQIRQYPNNHRITITSRLHNRTATLNGAEWFCSCGWSSAQCHNRASLEASITEHVGGARLLKAAASIPRPVKHRALIEPDGQLFAVEPPTDNEYGAKHNA